MRRHRADTQTHRCGECRHARPIHRPTLLSLKRSPILAECPYSSDRRRLLSENACKNHFKPISTAEMQAVV